MTDFQSGRRKRGWMNLRVQEIVHETHDTDTFMLVDADDGGRQFDYIAGQYLTFRFDDVGDKPIVRSYTMSSSPRQQDLAAFTVKRVEGGVISNWLCDQVKVGDVLRARGPIGRFVYEEGKDKKHLVMVAGGSGVTPFVSIMREYADRLGKAGAPDKLTLVVSHRSRQDLICHKDLDQVLHHKGVRLVTTLSREDATAHGFWHGRLSHEILQRALEGCYDEATFMSCGPQAIMDLTVEHAKRHGVADEHIKTESFES